MAYAEKGISITYPKRIGAGASGQQQSFYAAQASADGHNHSHVLGSLMAAAAVETLILFALCAAWFVLFEFVFKPKWPGLFPLAVDYSVILFLIALSLTSLYARNQYEAHVELLAQSSVLISSVVVLPPALAPRSMLEALASELKSRPAGRLLAESEAWLESRSTGEASIPFKQLQQPITAAQNITWVLMRLQARGLKRLSQIAIYFWAFGLPWALFSAYEWFGLIVFPFMVLPVLSLHHYGRSFQSGHHRHHPELGGGANTMLCQYLERTLLRLPAPVAK